MWTRENLAWVAGIIEGEGTFGNPGPKRDQFMIQVSMTDEDIIRRLREYTGLGQISGPHLLKQLKKDGTPRKPVWYWRVTKSAHSYALTVAVWRWLGIRRRAQARVRIDVFLSKKKVTLEDAFDRSFEVQDGCWIWTGSRRAGRPVFSHNREQQLAYRYSYKRYVDPNFKGRLTQTCGNLMCVKPDHLRPGRRATP